MEEDIFGGREPAYGVVTLPDGTIEVRVRHGSNEVHGYIRRHRAEPRWFLEHRENWSINAIRAKHWMAVLVEKYEKEFTENRVVFVWPAAGLPPAPSGTLQQRRAIDLEIVVDGSRELEQLLVHGFGAVGRGLGEKVTSVAAKLPPPLVREFRDIANVRNPVVHEGAPLESPEEFQRKCEHARAELQRLLRRG